MVLRFNKELYPKDALIKAAFLFTDKAYVHLDVNDQYYLVDLTVKENIVLLSIEDDFKNELLAQTARLKVLIQTKGIREIILARALASTVIGEPNNYSETDILQNKVNTDNVLDDWLSYSCYYCISYCNLANTICFIKL